MLSQEPSEVLCVDLTLSLWPPAISIRSLMPRLNALKTPALKCRVHVLQFVCLSSSYLYLPLDFQIYVELHRP